MDHKKAGEILINLLAKPALTEEEKAAISAAIGVLAWTSLAKSRINAIKAKHERKKYG